VSIERTITEKIERDLAPAYLEVKNESGMHNVPPGSETHFKVLVVSSAFDGLSLVARQRKVNALLREEFAAGLHALSLRALTPEQWEREQGAFESPRCRGGSKADDPRPGS
jgi:BolA protein